MSSFKDTFTKEDAKSTVLEYDDSAFMYFASTVLLAILVPWTYVYVRHRLLGSRSSAKSEKQSKQKKGFRYCECSCCDRSLDSMDLKCNRGLWDRLSSWGGITQTVCLVIGWIVVGLVISSLGHMGSISHFDPYEILNISMSATDKQIKKAYRTLSLRYHPDKNKNDALAAAKFILISKAYTTLTDEVARRNFEKFGNPDGVGLMKVGIGMPKVLVAEGAQVFFLAVFFTILLIVIPMAFIIYYNQSRDFAPSGVRVETVQFIASYMNERTRTKQTLQFLCASGEARALPLREDDEKQILAISGGLPSSVLRELSSVKDPNVKKAQTLIFAHLHRHHNLISPELQKDLYSLLNSSIVITKCMLEVAFMNNWFYSVYAVLELRRGLIQAMGFGHSPLLQLPHVDSSIVKKLQVSGIRELTELIDNPNKLELLNKVFNSDQQKVQNCLCVLDILPRLSISGTVEVEDESEVAVGDVATLALQVTRLNLKKADKQGMAHAPYFPQVKYDEWWMFASDSQTGQLLGYTTLKSREKVSDLFIQFPVTKAGRLAVIVTAICDCYFGIDVVQTYYFNVVNEIKKEIIVHPDDLALDDQPTLLQQMIGGADEQSERDSDSDEDDDEEHQENSPLNTGGQPQKMPSIKEQNNCKSVESSVSTDAKELAGY